MTDKVTRIETGLYKHYKGDYYWVLGTTQIDNEGERLVIYQDAAGSMHARWYKEFDGYLSDDEANALHWGTAGGPYKRYTKVDSYFHPPELRRFE